MKRSFSLHMLSLSLSPFADTQGHVEDNFAERNRAGLGKGCARRELEARAPPAHTDTQHTRRTGTVATVSQAIN